MGFSFRKSIRLGGGMRLNLSSRGVGVSGGVKGLRISSNTTRGTRLYAGVGGMRYQKSLNGTRRRLTRSETTSASSALSFDLENYPVSKPRTAWKRYVLLKWFGLLVVAGMVLAALSVKNLTGAALVAWQTYFWGSLAWAIYDSYNKSRRNKDALEGYKLFEQSQQAAVDSDRIEKMQSAVVLFPDQGLIARLAAALWAANKYQEALPYLRLSLELPHLRDVDGLIYKIGYSLVATKQYEEAISLFEQIDEKDEYEDFLDVLVLKARCYFEAKQYDHSMAVVKSVLAKRGEDAVKAKREMRMWQARILAITGEIKEAIAVAKRLVKDVPNLAEAQILLEELERKAI